MTVHIPALRSAILEHALFTSVFDRTSYEAIYSRIGAMLDIAKTYIDKVVSDPNHAPETVQAVIDQAVTTLNSHLSGINLPWVPDEDEVPFWRGLSIDARIQLELYAEYATNFRPLVEPIVVEEVGDDDEDEYIGNDPHDYRTDDTSLLETRTPNPPAPSQGCC